MLQLAQQFDAVLMLTWSDWYTEPRSNRYHYATRFAKHVPVLFLQHGYRKASQLSVTSSDVDGIDIVQVSCPMSKDEALAIKSLLYARGVKRPLVWIYDSMYYWDLLEVLSNGFFVYHATEDYLTPTKGWNQDMEVLTASIKRLMKRVDFVVACTEAVCNSYHEQGGYSGRSVVIENGCDAEYLIDRSAIKAFDQEPGDNIAIFQGGINQRVDYELLIKLAEAMPDWKFRFCGCAQPNDDWERLLRYENVSYLGILPVEEVVKQMRNATVGLIPYIQDKWIENSFPLKAYEYVAVGLPVVSVPIRCLEREPELFCFETTAEGFERAIRSSVEGRYDPELLKQRTEAALKNSYNSRFESMVTSLSCVYSESMPKKHKLRVAVIYDSMISMHVSTIAEHLSAFEAYSDHEIIYVPGTKGFWHASEVELSKELDFTIFDVVLVHYSIRLSVLDHLDPGVARAIECFAGAKILFIQDEYEGTETARRWMERLQFNVVYTCVPLANLDEVYPSYRFPGTTFLPTLTGYVPESKELLGVGMRRSSQRDILIAYRGRTLHPIYGSLGYEKFRIGAEMKVIAAMRGLATDIEVDDSKRVYGKGWYELLASARATLGTESGSNIFDYDGSIKNEIDHFKVNNPSATYSDLCNHIPGLREGVIRMNQISPKIFEAITLRTALILFEGTYSNIIEPGRHYIELKKDFSNIDDVLSKIQDDEYLDGLTDRAYKEIVASGKYSYRSFIRGIDEDINDMVLRSKGTKGLMVAYYRLEEGGIKSAIPLMPCGLVDGAHPLGKFTRLVEEHRPTVGDATSRIKLVLKKVTLIALSPLPVKVRIVIVSKIKYLGSLMGRACRKAERGAIKIARIIWPWIPVGARRLLADKFGKKISKLI